MIFALGALAAFCTMTLLAAIGGVGWWLLSGQRDQARAAPPAPDNPRTVPEPSADWWANLQALAYQVHTLETTVKGLPGLWKEEADRAQRAAERAQKAERRARARAGAEDEESEDDQLPLDHGGGGARGGLHAVRSQVASPDDQTAYLMEVRRQLALAPLKSN